jgi:hypothetical protein
MSFGLLTGFIGLFDTACDYTLQFTITHTLVPRVTSSLPLLSSGFQSYTFPFLWVLELSTAPNSNSSPQLPTSSWTNCNSKSKLCYDQCSVSQSILGVKKPPGVQDQILLLSDNQGFVDVGRPPWWEVGSVIYNCCCPPPAQSLLGPSPQDSWPYFTLSDLRLP